MAIYHFHMQVISRSKGKNAVSAAAYRHAAKFFDEQENQSWDYQKKTGVSHKEILVPENSPAWAKAFSENPSVDRASEKIWNLVEQNEKRADAQLAREAEFALPIELTQEQGILLAREFIHDQFVLRGMIADWSLHWDDGNPHVHVMLTMRSLEDNGFGLKVRAWNAKEFVNGWREKWAEYVNFHLKLNQHAIRIDHRSYREQGIELIPSTHQGKSVTDMDRRGIKTDIMKEANSIRQENLKLISEKPEALLNKISAQYETFTSHDLGHELGRYMNDKGKFSHKHKGSLSNSALENSESLVKEIHELGYLTPAAIAQLLKTIEHHESVFTERHLAKAIAPYTNNAESFTKALLQVKNSPELLHVGLGDDGRERFTTRAMFKVENNIQKLTDVIRKSLHVTVSHRRINTVLEEYQAQIGKQLTEEQLLAVKHVLKPAAISCVVGRAGTGKSFSLGAARAVWEAQGLRVQGVALSGIAADGLSKDAAIQSRTIHSFQYAIERRQIVLNHHDVVVMDEAGMTDSVSMLSVLKAIREARAKLVLVGDHAQIQPVGPGATFRAILERIGFAEIQTVYRQKQAWQREATVSFSAGRVAKGLTRYAEKQNIHFSSTEAQAMSQLVNDWFETRSSNSKNLDQYLVVAHRNKDVHAINALMRAERINRNEISDGYIVTGKFGEMKISKGDRLLFLKNDRRLGVNNGRFATIQTVEFTETGKATSFSVLLDGTDKVISINPKEYSDFTHGYAATVHKVQGMTVDHTLVYGDGYFWNRHLTYVAMSRHRESCDLYITDKDMPSLTNRMGKFGMKDSLLDFPLAFAERRGFDVGEFLKKLPQHLVEKLNALKERISHRMDKLLISRKISNTSNNVAQQSSQFIPTQETTLQDLLLRYVEMELDQTDMVNTVRSLRSNDPSAAKILATRMIEQAKQIKRIANESINHPEIIKEMSAVKAQRSPTLAERGGFSAMRERIKNNELTPEDVQILIAQMKNKCHDLSQVSTQERDHRGRSR